MLHNVFRLFALCPEYKLVECMSCTQINLKTRFINCTPLRECGCIKWHINANLRQIIITQLTMRYKKNKIERHFIGHFISIWRIHIVAAFCIPILFLVLTLFSISLPFLISLSWSMYVCFFCERPEKNGWQGSDREAINGNDTGRISMDRPKRFCSNGDETHEYRWVATQ